MQTTSSADEKFFELEARLDYRFKQRALLERALTHRSWAYEHCAPGDEACARLLHNEALEFVGDAVLGCVVAERLFDAFPHSSEGELSRMKHHLVSAPALARAARRLRLGEAARVGRGEEKTGGRRKQALLADMMEAVFAAVFLDGGIEAARSVVQRALREEFAVTDPQRAAEADYKTMLQERLQAMRLAAPQYEVIDTEGPPHRRIFHVEVRWDGRSFRASGGTIKAAEAEAARLALEQLK
jgi:ribonuclease-3